MRVKKSTGRRFLAFAGAIALATAGMVGASSAANAALPEGNPPPGQAESGTTGKLTVHKRVGVQGGEGNGSILDPVPGTPLPGVTFQSQRVGIWTSGNCVAIDLTTTAGWNAAAAAVGANPGAPNPTPTPGEFCVVSSASEETDVNGLAAFDNLALGLYYVSETATPANVVDPALPFYVTVPFPSKSGSGESATTTWLYDIHVYPKNGIADKPTKTINSEQTDLVLNADVTWTISQKIPTLTGPTSNFTEASISDPLDPRLTYVSGVVSIESPNGDNIAPADYVFDPSGLTWTFTETGLAKLKANQGKTLTATVVTTVTSISADGKTPGVVYNEATVSFNQKPQTTPKSYTYWGDLVVTKHDASNQAALAGAQFKVFAKGDGACAATMPATGALATGTSDATGVVKWDHRAPAASPLSLWVANSNTEIANPSKQYCLYESQAPAGYTPITTPWTVTITPATTASPEAIFTQSVGNTKVPGPNLPLTGSTGTAVFVIGGLALVLAASGAALVIARRRQHASKQ